MPDRFVSLAELYGRAERLAARVRDVTVVMAAGKYGGRGLPAVEATAGCLLTEAMNREVFDAPSIQLVVDGREVGNFAFHDAERIALGSTAGVVKAVARGIDAALQKRIDAERLPEEPGGAPAEGSGGASDEGTHPA